MRFASFCSTIVLALARFVRTKCDRSSPSSGSHSHGPTITGVGSILAGMDGAITGAIRSMGPTPPSFLRCAWNPVLGGRTAEERNRKPLTMKNASEIPERCPARRSREPYLLPIGASTGVDRVRYKGNDYYQPQIAGTDR